MEKKCRSCGETKDESEFAKGRRQCKECRRKEQREFKKNQRDENPEAFRAYRRSLYAKNPEKYREEKRRLRAANPEKFREIDRKRYPFRIRDPEKEREKSRRWCAQNPERHRDNVRSWRAENPEKAKEIGRKSSLKWRSENPEKAREQSRRSRARHPGKVLARGAKRRARIRAAIVPSDANVIDKFYEDVANARRIKCYWCKKYVPKGEREIDHKKPLARGGKHAAYNLCCSCRNCNRSKGAKTPEEFCGQGELFT